MKAWKMLAAALAVAASIVAATSVSAQSAGTQFMGILGYRVGPYGPNGAAFFTGFIDYLTLVNERDGGINGVKLSWEECETEYNNTKGLECYERVKTRVESGPTAIHPMSTGITYSLLDKALGPQGYWGVFMANMHTDLVSSPGSDAIISSALARGVPVISAKQILDWTTGRDASTFRELSWSG